MARFAVNISHLDDKTLAFLGYELSGEGEEFKVYTDKFLEDHIVARAQPLLFVEDINDAVYMSSTEVIAIGDDIVG